MNGYDLDIAHRIYPKVAKPAMGLPFSDIKFRLSEICLRSAWRGSSTLTSRAANL